jgi:glutamate racemase
MADAPVSKATMDAIGVFDSGVGGLTVVSALRRRLPGESILYLGDTARLPYGSKSPDTVTRYTRRNIEFLTERGVKAVVVACNTASALALPALDLQGVPTWGVIEPGARAAAAASRGKVGVIATEATVRSDAYPRALRALRPDLEILSQPCPLFVPLVEEGWHDDPITEQVAERYLRPLLDAGIDTLVLGCTHYPLLVPVLRRVAGPDVALVDSAEAVAEVVAGGLATGGIEAADSHAPEHHVCVTDAGEKFHQLAGRILGEDVTLEWVEVT